jgi:hypothetical protein
VTGWDVLVRYSRNLPWIERHRFMGELIAYALRYGAR